MTQPNFAILRTTKIKTVQKLASASLHNTRELDVPNADPTADAPRLVAGSENAYDRHMQIMQKCGIKPRKNAVLAVEHVCTFSPEADVADLDAWVEANLKFVERTYGDRGKILQAVLHTDESTPHMHILVSPLVHQKEIDKRIKDPEKIKNFKPHWKLNCREFLNGKAKMIALQDDYADAMKPFGLERGIRNSKATHKTINKFYSELNADIKAAEKEIDEILEQKPSFLGISKFASLVKDKLMELTKSAIALERQESAVRRREKRTERLMAKLDDLAMRMGVKSASNIPEAIQEQIDRGVQVQTERLECQVNEMRDRESELRFIERTSKRQLELKDQEIAELSSKNDVLLRKLRSNERNREF